MLNSDCINNDPKSIMALHPLLRQDADAAEAEPFISSMAHINMLVTEGIERDTLLVFSGEASGVSRYSGLDDLWDPNGDCIIALDEQEFSFSSRAIFETNSMDLVSLLSECECEKGKHFRLKLSPHDKRLGRIAKFNLAARNFIAVVMRKPIIGSSLVSALDDLQAMATHVFALQRKPEKAIEFVRDYVQEMKLDNCTNRSADIGKFLAWTERTRWARAFVETFAHCVGMLNCGVIDQTSLDGVSRTTRAILEQSCSQMHYDLATVEALLVSFGVDKAVLDQYGHQPGISRSLSAFQTFLSQHYSQIYGEWPPPVRHGSGHWLTRSLVLQLQKDFGNLYDLLVDTSVQLSSCTGKQQPKTRYPWEDQEIAPSTPIVDTFGSTFPHHEFFTSWNYSHGFDTLPHQDAIAPEFLPTIPKEEQDDDKIAHQSSLIPALQKHRDNRPGLYEVYSRATNNEVHISDFCKAFMEHETVTKHDDLDTHDGRLGRWMIVYCVMQLLSKVAVDIQGLRYRPGVEYFLHANLDGTPTWDPAKFPKTMRPASARYGWAAMFARATHQQKLDMQKTMDAGSSAQNRARKPRFEVVHFPDGRFMLTDSDGHIVFK